MKYLLFFIATIFGYHSLYSKEDFKDQFNSVYENIEKHCLDCHDSETEEGGINLEFEKIDLEDQGFIKKWGKVYTSIKTEQMPPAKKNKLNKEERKKLVNDIKQFALDNIDYGRTGLRKLSKLEYKNSLSYAVDVGRAIDLPRMFPDDVKNHGFRRIANSNIVTPELLISYYDVATEIASALVFPENLSKTYNAYELPYRRANYMQISKKFLGDKSNDLSDEQYLHKVFNKFLKRLFLRSDLSESYINSYVNFLLDHIKEGNSLKDAVFLGIRSALCSPKFIYRNYLNEESTNFNFANRLSYFLTNSPPDEHLIKDAREGKLSSNLVIKQHVNRLLSDRTNVENFLNTFLSQWLDYDKINLMDYDVFVVQKFAVLGYNEIRKLRIPALEYANNLIPYLKKSATEETNIFVKDILINNLSMDNFIDPDFIYLNRFNAGIYGLAYEWKKAFNDESNYLSKKNFNKYVAFNKKCNDRLSIADVKKRKALSLEKRKKISPQLRAQNIKKINDENLLTKKKLNQLRQEYKNRLLKKQFVRELYKFYKVKVDKGGIRGGLLTQSSVLMSTANGFNTSPVLRGVWILENLLGVKLGTPAEVPALEDLKTAGAKTLKDKILMHQNVEGCASCHKKIDPIGFATENFDPIGLWRPRYYKRKNDIRTNKQLEIDPTSVTEDGVVINDIKDMKKYLLTKLDDFSTNIAETLLFHATGRELNLKEKDEISQIVSKVKSKGNGFRDLLIEVILTNSFKSS